MPKTKTLVIRATKKDKNGNLIPIPDSNVSTQDQTLRSFKRGPLGTARLTEADIDIIREKLKK
jgi:hypothetical protein